MYKNIFVSNLLHVYTSQSLVAYFVPADEGSYIYIYIRILFLLYTIRKKYTGDTKKKKNVYNITRGFQAIYVVVSKIVDYFYNSGWCVVYVVAIFWWLLHIRWRWEIWGMQHWNDLIKYIRNKKMEIVCSFSHFPCNSRHLLLLLRLPSKWRCCGQRSIEMTREKLNSCNDITFYIPRHPKKKSKSTQQVNPYSLFPINHQHQKIWLHNTQIKIS